MTTFVRLRPYQKLIVWTAAHKLCLHTYKITRKFPPYEKFGLVSQMQRSSSSVPTNIAEGSGKSSPKERDRFFEYAWCSLEELHYQYVLSHDLSYISQEEFTEAEEQVGRVGFFLMKLRKSLK